MTPIHLRGIHKAFGQTTAVDAVDLEVEAGQLFFLLGPSGCGKTTLLRMLAGFIEPTKGSMHFGDKEVTHLPPNKRNTGMVFQGYALWPHMSVRQNVRFGLEVRKVDKAEMTRRVDGSLKQVQLLPLADRKINQLSGGQQQRVALARALVIEPTVLLMDEPLSNLDAKLRLEMRQLIRRLCKEAGSTAVYVTHDQDEALSMADRIAVLRAGRVEQVGDPRTLYDRPASRFVADFLGETNFMQAQVKAANDGQVTLDTPIGDLCSTSVPNDLPQAGNVTCSIRPECIKLAPSAEDPGGTNHFHATRSEVVYLGALARYHLNAGTTGSDQPLKAFELNPKLLDIQPDQLTCYVAPKDVVVLDD